MSHFSNLFTDLITDINVTDFYNIVLTVIEAFCLIIPLLIAVAYLTLLERKVIGAIQRRRGPSVVGIFGLLQAFADAVKLLIKETIYPANADLALFIAAPMFAFGLSILPWAVIPIGDDMVYSDLNLGMLYLLAISSLSVYGILIAGWSTNSKYAFLGGLRAASQMISYEVSIGIILCTVLVCAGSLNINTIIEAQETIWYICPLLPLGVIFFISSLAETGRTPFDLMEDESALVAGYFVEYSAVGFVLFFLGEYTNMLFMSSITTILFLGGWLPPFGVDSIFGYIPCSIWFGLKVTFVVFIFIWVRASLPRYRYDQLMSLGWKVFLPFTFAYFIFNFGILWSFDALPLKQS